MVLSKENPKGTDSENLKSCDFNIAKNQSMRSLGYKHKIALVKTGGD